MAAEDKTLRIGYMHAEDEGLYAHAPAITLAIEDMQAQGQLTDYNFELAVRGDVWEPKKGTRSVVDLYTNDNVDVVFGPIKSRVCETAAYYLSYWNIPFYTHGCMNPVLSNKTTFNTLVRLAPTYGKLGQAFGRLFEYYDWHQAVFLMEEEGEASICHYGAQGIAEAFKKRDIKVAEWVRLSPVEHGPIPVAEIDYYLRRIQDRARVIIMCRDDETERKIMTRAHAMGMTNGDYAFFKFTIYPPVLAPWIIPANATEREIEEIKAPYKVLKGVTFDGKEAEDFEERVRLRGLLPPWNFTAEDAQAGGQRAMVLYDAVHVYLNILTAAITEGQDIRKNGDQFNKMARNMHFVGETGVVNLDHEADRDADYAVWQISPEHSQLHEYALIPLASMPKVLVLETEHDHWYTENNLPPLSVPKCGFRGELCPSDNTVRDVAIIIGSLVAVVGTCIAFSVSCYRKQMITDTDVRQMTWQAKFEDIEFEKSSKVFGSKSSSGVSERGSSLSLAHYQAGPVVVKKYQKSNIALTKTDLMELNIMRGLTNENINPFIGACIYPPNICTLTAYCPRGTLMDIIGNTDIKLDWMFKKSIMTDLVNGMGYLHGTALRSHGRLKSSNCLVDSRWVLKISSFGLHAFREGQKKEEQTEYKHYWDMLWTSPELLRMEKPVGRGTQKGDVYSFGIILQELVFRTAPYFDDSSSPKDVIQRLKSWESPPYRPSVIDSLDFDHVHSAVLSLMLECWEENTDNRPPFDVLKKRVCTINKGRTVNIMDDMVLMLEKYANNLEEIVEQRTGELVEEKKKTDALLYRMLPKVVAERLKTGMTVTAQMFEGVTVYFSDVVGFTELSSMSTPMEVVNLLNDLYTMFDYTISKHNVYKVETIGDAYMVVSGAPQPNGNRHVAEIANASLSLLREVTKFKIRHMPSRKMKLRIGVHSGPCAAGVVGLTMPRYCMFGDTVNMASRMETSGEAGKIHISQQTTDALEPFTEFQVTFRGNVEIKGKGILPTYWLSGKDA